MTTDDLAALEAAEQTAADEAAIIEADAIAAQAESKTKRREANDRYRAAAAALAAKHAELADPNRPEVLTITPGA